jgi:uncharacterized protein (TIGR03545 family)
VQTNKIEEGLTSKKKLREFEKALGERSKKWDERLKTLPSSAQISKLGDRLAKVKTSNFKNAEELMNSLREIDAILKEADGKYKTISSMTSDLNNELTATQIEYREIDAAIKKDIADLQSRFRIPKLDAKSLTMAILGQYMAPYMEKINRYRSIAEKYIPPNLIEKIPGADQAAAQAAPDMQFQPRPRAKGVSYEFGKPNSYPAFWIKKVVVSSKAGVTPTAGDMKGSITDISSNQLLTGQPTVARFEGSFPGLDIQGFSAKASFDNRVRESLIGFNVNVASYGISGRDVATSEDTRIAFKKAVGMLKSHGQIHGLKKLEMGLESQISKIDYDISGQNQALVDILKGVFQGIPMVSIDAGANGDLPDFALDINSNIGPELQKGFEKQISKKIEVERAKFNAAVDQAIGQEKAKVESDLAKIQNQIHGETKKLIEQIAKEKVKAEKQANQAKNEGSKQGEKQLNDEARKAAEELKRRLGL